MKNRFLTLLILPLLLLAAPIPAKAECVNNVDTVTGRTCIVVSKSSTATGGCSNGNCTYVPLEPLPGVDYSGNNFPAFVSGMFRLLITLGGMFAVLMLVIAGIGYMIKESAVDIQRAKDRAKAALYGLLILTACWLILYTINPNLLRFDLFKQTIDRTAAQIPGATSLRTPSNSNTSADAMNSADSVTPTKYTSLTEAERESLAEYLNGKSTTATLAGKVGLGYSVIDGQVLDNGEELTPENIKALDNFSQKCSEYWFAKTKVVSGREIGLSSEQDVQICYR